MYNVEKIMRLVPGREIVISNRINTRYLDTYHVNTTIGIRRKMRRDWRGSRCPTWCRAG